MTTGTTGNRQDNEGDHTATTDHHSTLNHHREQESSTTSLGPQVGFHFSFLTSSFYY